MLKQGSTCDATQDLFDFSRYPRSSVGKRFLIAKIEVPIIIFVGGLDLILQPFRRMVHYGFKTKGFAVSGIVVDTQACVVTSRLRVQHRLL